MEIRADIEQMNQSTVVSMGWCKGTRTLGLLSLAIINLYLRNLVISTFFVVLDNYCESVPRRRFQSISKAGSWSRKEGQRIEDPVYSDFFLSRSSNPEAVLFSFRWIYTVLIKRPLSHTSMLWIWSLLSVTSQTWNRWTLLWRILKNPRHI